MSSSSNVTALIRLLIAEGESPPTSVSARSAERVSLRTALAGASAAVGFPLRTIPVANATKKAIVLLHVDDTPLMPQSQSGVETTWYKTMTERVLPRFELPGIISSAIAATGITNYPKYRIWILPDNLNSDFEIPSISDGEVVNIANFPVCSVKDVLLAEALTTGALIRVDFENRLQGTGAYVTNVINNNEEFGRAIFNELGGVISPREACEPCGDERPSVSHYRGHAIPAGGSTSALHNAYVALSREAGKNQIDSAALYSILESRLGDSKLALGILANAMAESTLDANVISGVATESSIGLWQMNVQIEGSVQPPSSGIMTRARELPESIRIPSTSSVVVYFGGGQLAKKHGVSVVTPVDYAGGNQDVSEVYELVSDSTKQIDFVVEVTKNMLAEITYNSDDITAGNWAQWFQIYFEQPGAVKDRSKQAKAIKDDLGLSVTV